MEVTPEVAEAASQRSPRPSALPTLATRNPPIEEKQTATPLQPSLVSESGLDFVARAQTAALLSLPPSDQRWLLGEASSKFRPPLVLGQTDPVNRTPAIADPDLGVLRVRQAPPDRRMDSPDLKPPLNCDPELGCLRLREPLPLPPIVMAAPHAPVVYVIARADYFRNSNLFSDQNPVAEGLSRPGITVYASPMLGRDTYWVASATGNLIRYSTQSRLNADELLFRAGILQRLSPTMLGEIGWSNQQLFISSDKLVGIPKGTRFLNEHAIRLELSRRDQITNRLSLSSFYQFRYSFADPIDRSRITNALTLSLNYDLQPNLQLGLDYQLGLANFTQQKRRDLYNQVLGRLTYTLSRSAQVSAFVGYGFGNSSDQSIRFDSLLVGVSLSLTLGLF